MHEIHTLGDVQRHLVSLLEADLRDRLAPLVQHLEEGASRAKLRYNDWSAFLANGGTHEHHKARVRALHQRTDLSLKVLRKLLVVNKALYLELLDGDVSKLILRFKDMRCRALSNLLRIL
jgi:hypothetical protein